LVVDSSVPVPEQHHCQFCGDAIPAGDRRPRKFCSGAHRLAALRTRRATSEALTQRPPAGDAPTTESTKNDAENHNEISGRNFVTDGPLVPLDLFGRGYRWPGVKANGNAVRIAAAIDAELGAGAEWLTSPGGARYQVVPRRAR
jgi:predicted nucleic acid-binding Zn ribbon protein